MQHTTAAAAIAAIDRRHAADPAGRELGYAERMSDWLARLAAAPSPALEIAVRAQHFERWTLPRGDFPAGRRGYLEWRRTASAQQAAAVETLLAELGYAPALVTRVGELMQKRRRSTDPEAQALEDCACLVFLDTELERFMVGRDEGQLVNVIAKTWRKMSEDARAAAQRLSMSPAARALVDRAITMEPPLG